MNILIVSPDYPDKKRSCYSFVKQLVDQFARIGHNCYVLAPYSLTRNNSFSAFKESYILSDNKKVTVLRPNYISVSTLKIGSFNISNLLYENALERGLRKIPFVPDIIYAHFWICAKAVFKFAKENDIPLFVATGESCIKDMYTSNAEHNSLCNYVSGVICVSNKNLHESVELGLTTIDKCAVFPNAIDSNLFRRQNRIECRKSLGFPQDAFIVAFVGGFINRKGPDRVANAIRRCSSNINSIFIGKGNLEPLVDGILFKGCAPHDKIPMYLGAADIFVLPTLLEGCCNAIVEAMACGLPIVSSNLPFNWDILNESNSIMVDPNDIEEISSAIMILHDSPVLRKNLSDGALKKASSLTIERRAESILNFIKSKMQ